MTARRNFYWDIRGIVNSALEDLKELDKKEKAIENKIKSNRYTTNAVQTELKPEMSNIKRSKEKVREEAISAVRARTNEYIAELQKADELNPGNLTDDIKLLQLGVTISPDDLEKIFDRNTGNSTMQKLIADYARQNNIDIRRSYKPTNFDLIKNIECIPEAMGLVVKWNDKPNIYNQFIGDGSSFDILLSDE